MWDRARSRIMSVSIVENWSDVVGRVRRISAAPEVPGFTAIRLSVFEVKDVEPYANLLVSAVGTDIDILAPARTLAELALTDGAVLACRIRLARNQKIFAHTEQIRVVDE